MNSAHFVADFGRRFVALERLFQICRNALKLPMISV